jgi:hypothetical protein
MKTCSKCKISKPLSEFTKRKSMKDGHHSYCKDCKNFYRKTDKSYRNKEKEKIRRIKNDYNLTEEELDNLYVSQNKRCKICNTEYEKVSEHKGLYIDHCHITGKVRGLLCATCNRLLGACKDDVDILRSAIDYLQNK